MEEEDPKGAGGPPQKRKARQFPVALAFQHPSSSRTATRSSCALSSVLCTCRLTASMVNEADGVVYVKLTVKIVNYAVNRQSLVTVTPFFTIVIYVAIFE